MAGNSTSVVIGLGTALATSFLVAIWARYSFQRPLLAFGWIVFLTTTVYERLRSGYLLGAGGQGHGSISLIDLVWLVFVIVAIARLVRKRTLIVPSPRMPLAAWIGLPYVTMSITLPVIGALYGSILLDWPISFVATGVRQLQWLSFAFIAYWLAKTNGPATTLAITMKALVAAGVVHALYGVVQLGARSGFLPSAWRALDDFYVAGGASWLSDSSRLTGLYVMPTAYGNLGALLVIAGSALALSRVPCLSSAWATAALVAGGFIVIMSGDRVALVALIAALVASASASIAVGYGIIRVILLGPFVFLVAIALVPTYPSFIRSRFEHLLEHLLTGPSAVQNVAERFERWRYYIEVVQPMYPAGTWIQPRFVGGETPDSYIITLLAQGTVVYVLAFLFFIFGVHALGIMVLDRTGAPKDRWLGVLVIGYVVFVSIASLGGSIMFDVTVVVALWIVLGVALVTLRRRSRPVTPEDCEQR